MAYARTTKRGDSFTDTATSASRGRMPRRNDAPNAEGDRRWTKGIALCAAVRAHARARRDVASAQRDPNVARHLK